MSSTNRWLLAAVATTAVVAAAPAAELAFFEGRTFTSLANTSGPPEFVSGNGLLFGRPVATADFDGDGHADAAFHSWEKVVVAFGDGTGGVRSTGSLDVFGSFLGIRAKANLLALDIDLDGDTDVVATMRRNGSSAESAFLWVLRNDGAGTLTKTTLALPDGATFALAAGRIDADLFPDLVVGINAGGVWLMTNDRAGGFTLDREIAPGTWQMAEILDVNGDASADVVLHSGRNEPLRVLTNDGAGALTALPAAGNLVPSGRLVFGDFDGDDHADLLTYGSLFHGDGTGAFPAKTTWTPASGSVRELVAEDVDNDGALDAVLVVEGGDVAIQRGDGAGNFAPAFPVNNPADPHTGSFTTYAVAFADFDATGRVDALVVSDRDPPTLLLQAGGPPPELLAVEPGVVTAAGETVLRITGDHIVDGAEVSLGAIAETLGVTVESPTSLTARVRFLPGVGGGSRSVVVRNPDEQQGESAVLLHSIALEQRRGTLRDGIEPARDVLKLKGRLAFTTLASPGGMSGVIAQGFSLRIGDPANPVVVNAPPDDPRWFVSGRRARGARVWSTRLDEFPRIRFAVDTRNGNFRLDVSYYDHPAIDSSQMAVTMTSGADFGEARHAWGVLRDGVHYRFGR